MMRKNGMQSWICGVRCLAAAVFVVVSAPLPAMAAGTDFRPFIQQEFEVFDPDYRQHYDQFAGRLREVAGKLAAIERTGAKLHCSEQMYLEAKWQHRYTARWDDLEDKIERIELSLGDPNQEFAAEQSPVDGFWGVCYDQWFLRLGATITGFEQLAAAGKEPRYKLRSRGIFDTGKKLLTRLQDLLISDIAHVGVNNRGELSSLLTTFAQASYKPHIRDLLITAAEGQHVSQIESLREAYRFFLAGAQDSETGYWGAWYIKNGIVHRSIDLSMTYHIIVYSHGEVDHWQEIIATTMAIDGDPYPYGWMHDGKWNNHNLYDVTRILKYGWSHVPESQKPAIQEKLEEMLRFSLHYSFDEDGSFIHAANFSDSLSDEYYFGVSFYDAIGLWSPKSRFWTDRPLAFDEGGLCCRLKQHLETSGWEGWAAQGALAKIQRNCSAC